MYSYWIVLRKSHDRIVRSDGAAKAFEAGSLVPFFKEAKIKLVKTEENEFEIVYRNRGERVFINTYLTGWDESDLSHLTEDEIERLGELVAALPKEEATFGQAEGHLASAAEQAARIREIISQPGYRLTTVPNAPSDGSGSDHP